MILIPLLALVVGGVLALFATKQVPAELGETIGVAALAGIDTVFGGIRAGYEGRFKNDLFVTGFVSNVVLAVGLVYLGDLIGVPQLYLAAVITLGGRMFVNLSIIRRHYLARIQESIQKRKQVQE
ncbi:MAG: small basic family protein [Fimbriimonadales bacterium]